MTQYNTLNVKLCNPQLNKLKPRIKSDTEVTLNLSSNVIGDSKDGINFPHKSSLTDRIVSRLRKAFAANIKLLKTQLSEIVQSGGFLGRLSGPLLKACLPLMKYDFL